MPHQFRESLHFVFMHPSTSQADNPSPSFMHVFLSYTIAGVTAAGMIAAYEFALRTQHDWALMTFLGLAFVLAAPIISFWRGWGPGAFYSTIATMFAFGLFRSVHSSFVNIAWATAMYAILFALLNHTASAARLFWSLHVMKNTQHVEELRAANERLEAEAVAKNEFINTASHELRTPLTTLSLTARLLQHHLPPGETAMLDARKMTMVRGHVALMNAQLSRVIASLGDMTDAIHLEQKTLVMHPEDVDMGELVANVVDECRLLFDDHEIIYHRPQDTLNVNGDTYRFAQAIYHYISNACKYSPLNEPVRVAVHREKDEVHVAVYDQGYGVPYDQQDAIWERGYHRTAPQQAHSSHIGLGLGLYISKSIIEQHGGRVGVRSSVGGGSTFWLALPATEYSSQESYSGHLPVNNIVSFLGNSAAISSASTNPVASVRMKDTLHADVSQ